MDKYKGVNKSLIIVEERESDFIYLKTDRIISGQKAWKDFKEGIYAVLFGIFFSIVYIAIYPDNGTTQLLSPVIGIAIGLYIFKYRKPKYYFWIKAKDGTVSFEGYNVEFDDWGGFLIKEPKENSGQLSKEYHLFIRNKGVDYKTNHTIFKSEQTPDIINQINMLLFEAVGKSNSDASVNNDLWV